MDEIAGGGHDDLDGKTQEERHESDHRVRRIAVLEEELRKLQSQFTDYKIAVKKTLDDRLDAAGSPPSSTKSRDDKKDQLGSDKEDAVEDDSHYFKSYSYNGQYLCYG